MDYELSMYQNIEEKSKKKKIIALKSMTKEDNTDDESDESNNKDEIAMIIGKLEGLWGERGKDSRRRVWSRGKQEKRRKKE